MKFTQKTSIYGLDYDATPIECNRDTRNDQYPILSNAFFCVNCGSIWARIIRYTEIKKLEWEIIHTQCLTCAKNNPIPARLNVSGSIWNPFIDRSQLDYLPVEV